MRENISRKAVFLIIALAYHLPLNAKVLEVYSPYRQMSLGLKSLYVNLSKANLIALSEFHNTKNIQLAQAQIIDELAKYRKEKPQLFWEFLNYTEQKKISYDYDRLPTDSFLEKYIGPKQAKFYSPIIQKIKLHQGHVFGLNLPRPWKQKVIKDGIDSIPKEYIPPQHYIGGDDYKKRFYTAMKGHTSGEKIEKYFEVQCLTDSIMAQQLALKLTHQLNILIAGNFHLDFEDGTLVRLKNLIPLNLKSLKIVEKSAHTQEDLKQFKLGHPEYGIYADYIVVTGEN